MNSSPKKAFSFSSWDEISPSMFEEKDFLTEVFLRSSLEPFLQSLIQAAEKTGGNFSLVFMDLDRFKKINDKYGHLFGDDVLRYVGSSLRLSFQGIPCRIFRYGGDEFIIVFPHKVTREARQLVQILKHTLAHRPILFRNKLFKISASYGIATYPADATTVEDVLKKADMALYFSKHQGRNCVIAAGEVHGRRILNKVIISVCFILGVSLSWINQEPVIRFLRKSVWEINHFTETVRQKNSDKVVLKDGMVIYGEIVNETNHALTISYRANNEIVHLFLEKTKIREKTYGRKTSSRERFEEYLKRNPNPHF